MYLFGRSSTAAPARGLVGGGGAFDVVVLDLLGLLETRDSAFFKGCGCS